MKIENDMTPLLNDNNGRIVLAGNGRQLGDAVRSLSSNKVFRVASVTSAGMVRLANANGTTPKAAYDRWCPVASFSSKFKFDCAAW
jgi:hypothetical protein